MCKNPTHQEKTKHIDIKQYFVRNEVPKGTVKMVKIHTDENLADALTKVVLVGKFRPYLDIASISDF